MGMRLEELLVHLVVFLAGLPYRLISRLPGESGSIVQALAYCFVGGTLGTIAYRLWLKPVTDSTIRGADHNEEASAVAFYSGALWPLTITLIVAAAAFLGIVGMIIMFCWLGHKLVTAILNNSFGQDWRKNFRAWRKLWWEKFKVA